MRRASGSMALVAVVLLAACGSGGTSGTASGTQASAGGGAPTPGATAAPTPPASSGFVFNFSLPPEPTWPPVGGKVRIVNLYDPGTEAPFAVDVRQSGVIGTSVPIATVQPGTVSDWFDPGDSGDGSAELDFFRAGSGAGKDLVMHQGWSDMKGREITIVLFTSMDPPAAGGQRNYGGDYVVEERGGTNPLPAVTAGQGLLWLDVQSLDALPRDAQWPQAGVGLGKGTCLADDEDRATGSSFTFVGGRSAYTLPAGSINVSIWGNVSTAADCTGKPDLGPIPVTLAAGKITWLIVSGPDLTHLRTLVVPIAP